MIIAHRINMSFKLFFLTYLVIFLYLLEKNDLIKIIKIMKREEFERILDRKTKKENVKYNLEKSVMFLKDPETLDKYEYLNRVRSVQIRSNFWSVFSRIWTEYVFTPNAGKYGPEITQYLDAFHAVLIYQDTFSSDQDNLIKQNLKWYHNRNNVKTKAIVEYSDKQVNNLK